MYVICVCWCGVQHVLIIWITWWMFYKRQEQLTFHEHLSLLPPLIVWVRVAHLFSFLCCPIMCLYVLSFVLWCPLRFPHTNDVRFFYLQLFVCLTYVICICLRIVVSNTYCVVFLLCCSSSCVPCAARIFLFSFL